jgi:signal transduction histidine kinase
MAHRTIIRWIIGSVRLSMVVLLLLIHTEANGTEDFLRSRDSLLRIIQHKNTVEEAHTRCHLGSLYYRNFQFNEGLEQAQKALETGRAQNNESLIIRAHRLHADLYYAMAEYELSLKHFQAELEIQHRRKDRRKIAEVHCNIGVIYDVRGYLEKGLFHYLEALKLYEEVDDKEGLVATLSNLAFISKGQGNHREAIRYFEQASRIEAEHLTQKKPHYFLVNMAEDYVSLDEFDRAEEYLIKAGKILNSIEKPDDEDILIWLDQARIAGDVYLNTNRGHLAMDAYEEALQLAHRSGYKEKEGPVLIRIGSLLEETGKYDEADKMLSRALDIGLETGSLTMQRYAYIKLAKVAEKQNQLKRALGYLRQYNTLNDSIITKESAVRMSEMRAIFEAKQKETQIRLLLQENEIQQLNAQKSENRLIFSFLLAIFLLLALGLFYTKFKFKARTSKLLEEKNTQLTLLNATKDKFFTIIAHDLKNPVTSFHRISQHLDHNLESLKTKDLRYFMHELSSAAGNLNQLLGNLLQWARSQRNQISIEWKKTTPATLIQSAMDDVASNAALKNLNINVNNPHNPQFPTDGNIATTVLRNILSNAVKFSPSGGSIQITVANHSKEVLFIIEDQGPGIHPEDLTKLFRIDRDARRIGKSQEKGTGLGLILCAEIIEKIEGRIWAESEFGNGSRFYISLPMVPDLMPG